jgi:hypothetical protein
VNANLQFLNHNLSAYRIVKSSIWDAKMQFSLNQLFTGITASATLMAALTLVWSHPSPVNVFLIAPGLLMGTAILSLDTRLLLRAVLSVAVGAVLAGMIHWMILLWLLWKLRLNY